MEIKTKLGNAMVIQNKHEQNILETFIIILIVLTDISCS